MYKIATLEVLVLVFLSGCSSTGGTIAGLFPAPKFLKGEVENSVYHAADNSFEINTPFKEGTPMYTYMEVKEQYANIGDYVSFNTSVEPNEFYRIEIGKKLDKSQPSPKFEDLVEGLLGNYKKQLLAYGSEATVKWRTETSLDGKKAELVTLKQQMPAKSSYQGSSDGFVTYHIIYVVESPNGGAGAVWVQWPHGCKACENGPESDVLSTNERIKSFIQSFRLKI